MQGSKKQHKIRSYLISIVILIAMWEALSLIILSPALPDPYVVLYSFVEHLKTDLPEHFFISEMRVLCALALALSLSIPLGTLSYKEKTDKFTAPFLYILYPIPQIVLLPLFILLFGIGNLSKILLISFITFFQMWMTIRDAARHINKSHVYSLVSLGANGWHVYKHVVFPSVLPKVFTGLRISIGTAIAVLFFVESFATSRGLGYMIMEAWGKADYASLYAGMVAMALMGFGLYIILEIIERKVCRWLYLA